MQSSWRRHELPSASATGVCQASIPSICRRSCFERWRSASALIRSWWTTLSGADAKILNPNGGAIALGRPLGGSGARLMTTLVYHMRDKGICYGLQTMCEGGGQANATILELLLDRPYPTARSGAAMDETHYDQFRKTIISAIWHELAPLADEIEEHEELPYDRLFPALREMRAFALTTPQHYGGLGLTMTQYVPIIAEFAKVHGGIRALVHVHNSFAHALFELGNERQRADLLPGCADGTKSIAFALTEPDHGTGSDVGTSASLQADEYVIEGRKWLITNSDFASHFIVICKVADRPSAILVERDRAGLTIEPLPELMGCKGGAHGLLTFKQVSVPRANLIGDEGRGLAAMEQALEISRVLVAASSLGTAERALDLSLNFAKARVTFGRPISDRQAVQRYIAEMTVDVHALRLLLADATAKSDAGKRIPAEASICKLFGLEAVGRVTDRALLVHGGIGYTRRHQVERLYRDARLNWLEEGTPTIQHLVIAREALNGAFPSGRDACRPASDLPVAGTGPSRSRGQAVR